MANDTRQAQASDYAVYYGAYSSSETNYEWNTNWLLRTPGYESGFVVSVNYKGERNYEGEDVNDLDMAIRPVMHIDLTSECVKSAGTVSANSEISKGGIQEIEKERAEIVDDLIAAIGTVTVDSRGAIEIARKTYEALSNTSKDLVSNYDVLVEAERELEEAEKATSEATEAPSTETTEEPVLTPTLAPVNSPQVEPTLAPSVTPTVAPNTSSVPSTASVAKATANPVSNSSVTTVTKPAKVKIKSAKNSKKGIVVVK